MSPITSAEYTKLPDALYAPLPYTSFSKPEVFVLNDALAQDLQIPTDWLKQEAESLLTGRQTAHAHPPVAMAYSGHQFGNYAPLLGDGRAMLIGDAKESDGTLHEVHLKGSGLTPYSRGGDGKATLGAAVREYVVSEAMAGLGVPTSRSLAIMTTGETIMRQTPAPGAILTRTARSHLRVGTFQYTAANHDEGTLRALADFAIERLDSELKSGGADRYAQFLAKVAERQAKLIAQWMSFGFIHGVMNTDNMTLSGETIDYGPCAFMDAFHPAKVFSSIDHYGRYAWNKQPEIGLWNLSRLAEAMLPLFAEDEAKQIEIAEGALKEYPNIFKAGWTDRMIQKLGLPEGNHDDFINDTLTALMDGKVDFTRFFTALTRLVEGGDRGGVVAEFERADQGKDWLEKWTGITGGPNALGDDKKQNMRASNPVRIARNHQVEKAIIDAESGERGAFDSLLEALKTPFSERSEYEAYEAAPEPEEIVHQTFCGT